MTDKSFNNWLALTDKALLAQMGAFIRHHRMEQNKTQDELAAAAAISRSTLSLLERGETVTVSTLLQVLRVLNQLSVMDSFQVHERFSPLALAKLRMKKRKRARISRGNHTESTGKSDW